MRLEDMVNRDLDALTGLTIYDRIAAVLDIDMSVTDFEAMDVMKEVIRIAGAIEIMDVTLNVA